MKVNALGEKALLFNLENYLNKNRQNIDQNFRPNFKFDSLLNSKSTELDNLMNELIAKKNRVEQPQKKSENKIELIKLGAVTKKNPTVSNLLIKHPVYGKKCWKIIYAKVNSKKPYTKIPVGEQIFINPKTNELIWGKDLFDNKNNQIKNETKIAKTNDNVSKKLINAVEPFMGHPYEKVNCYELLVKGLKGLGVKYCGTGGLKSHLLNMAKKQGLAENAFHNGEGLIKALGTKLHSKSYNNVYNPNVQAEKFYDEMKPFLSKGCVLSFSIHSQGHTGIISEKNNNWTFINSGKMDHHINKPDSLKRVGEETLFEEIKNWFNIAKEKNESLKITLGRFKDKKLGAFFNKNKGLTSKIA